MKYTKEQRLDIGRRIYDGEITKYEAATQYDISQSSLSSWASSRDRHSALYRDVWREEEHVDYSGFPLRS